MKRLQTSPLTSYSTLPKPPISADQQPDPVQVLQLKLQTLEQKYLNFIDRCSDLLRSDKLSTEAKDLISSCSSSSFFSPNPPTPSIKDTNNLLTLLNQLENGSLLKHLMSTVSNTIQATQFTMFKSCFFSEKSKKTVQDSHKSLTAEIWQGLFNYEHYVQSAVKSCIRKIKEYEEPTNFNLLEQGFKEKYLRCKGEKSKLEKKLAEFSGNRFGDTQQSSKSSRSLVASPTPTTKKAGLGIGCRVLEGSCKSRLKDTAENNLGLRGGESYEVEKKEIQDQLRNLQVKLQGFEKVAKSLIDSSIRAELNSIGTKPAEINLTKVYESPDISMFGSHMSILDIDLLHKNLETLEKEKEELESTLKNEKTVNKKLEVENWEKNKKIRKIEEEFERVNQELGECLKEILREKEKKAEIEKKIRETEGKLRESEGKIKEFEEKIRVLVGEKEKLEKNMNGLNENRKVLSEKVKEKDKAIDGLMAEINSSKISYSVIFEKNKALKLKVKKTKEEKFKIMSFSAKHAESAKKCEEDLRGLEETLRISQETEKKMMRKIEVYEDEYKDSQILIKKIKENEEVLAVQLKNEISKCENFEQELRLGKTEKENLEKKYLKLNKEFESAENEIKKLRGVLKVLESELEREKKVSMLLNDEKMIVENTKKSLELKILSIQNKEHEAKTELNKVKTLLDNMEIEKFGLLKKIQELNENFQLNTEEKVKNLEKFNKTLEETIKKQRDTIICLDQEQSSACKSLAEAISKLTRKKLAKKSLKDAHSLKQNQFVGLETAYNSLKQEFLDLQNLKSEVIALKSSLSLSQATETELKSQILDKNEQLSLLQSKISESELNRKTIESNIITKDLELNLRVKEVSDIQFQLSTYIESINTLKSNLSEAHSQIEILKARYNDLQNEKSVNDSYKIGKLTEDLKDSEKNVKSLKNELNETQNLLGQQTKVQESLKEKLENLKNENEELLLTLSSRSEALIKLKTCLKNIRQDLKGVKSAVLRSELTEIKNFVLKKSEEFKNFIQNPHNFKYIENVIQEHKNNIQSLNTQNSGLFLTVRKLNTKYETLLKDYNKKSQELSATLTQNSSLEGQIRNSEFNEKNTQKTLNLKLESLESELREKNSNKSELLKTIKSLTKDQETLKMLLQKSEEKNKELSGIIKNLSVESEKLTEKNTFLNTDLEVYDQKMSEKIQKIVSLSEQNEALEHKISDLELIKNSIDSEKNKQIQILTEKIESLQKQLIDFEDLKEKVKINNIEFFQIDQENQQLHKKLEVKLKDQEKLSENLNKAKLELEKTQRDHKNLVSENQRLIEIQITQSQDAKNLKACLEAKENSTRELEIALGDKNRALEDLKNALFSSQMEINAIKLGEKKLDKPGLPRSSDFGPCPQPIKSKTGSLGSNVDPFSIKQSLCTEELNITPCKLLKVVKYRNKKWALVQSEEGSFIWKEEQTFQPQTLLEPYEEDLEEIKICLASWYKGSIIDAIEELKKLATSQDYSFQADDKYDMLSQSFKGEIFEAGLEISKIDIHVQENENFEQLSQELNLKNSELALKNKKIEKKKRTLLLHKEQIVVLKEQIRSYQDRVKELESMAGVDLMYLKQVYSNLIVKIKVNKGIEDLILVVFKVLGFSQAEIGKIQERRKKGNVEVSGRD